MLRAFERKAMSRRKREKESFRQHARNMEFLFSKLQDFCEVSGIFPPLFCPPWNSFIHSANMFSIEKEKFYFTPSQKSSFIDRWTFSLLVASFLSVFVYNRNQRENEITWFCLSGACLPREFVASVDVRRYPSSSSHSPHWLTYKLVFPTTFHSQ